MDEMTVPELNAFLELLAKLVEATAKDPADAARIIRESIAKEQGKHRQGHDSLI